MASGIGLTIGSHSLRMVEVRRKGPVWQVTDARAVALSGKTDEARVAEARGIIGALGLKGPVLLGLTGRDLIVRYTRAPRVPDWRLEMLMRFEIEEVAEQSGGDVAADWALLSLPAAAGEDDTVLVALARNAHLRPRLEGVEAAGLLPLGGCPRSIALYHAFLANAAIPPGEVTMMLHLGGENTDVALQRDGALLFARNLSGGGQPFTEALTSAFRVSPDTAERMKIQKGNVTPRQKARYGDSSEEKVANTLLGTAGNVVAAVHSSVMFCKAQTKLTDLRVDRVLLTGAGAKIRGMTDYLSSGLGIPVEMFDPFAELDLTQLRPEAAEAVGGDGPSMVAALGLAQMAADPKAFRLAILPEAERRKRHFAQHTAWLIGSGVVAAAGLVFLFSSAAGEEAKASSNEKEINTAIEKAVKLREEGAGKRKKVEAAVKRLALLQDEIRVGPAFERGYDTVQEVISSSPVFQAIHFYDVKARFSQVEIPKEYLPEPDPNAPVEKDSRRAPDGPMQARIPVMVLQGSIQTRGEAPAKVLADFTTALGAAVKDRIPRGVLKMEGGLRGTGGKQTFEVRIHFFENARPVGR